MRNSLFCVSSVQKHARFFFVLEVRFSRAPITSSFCIRINFVGNLSSFRTKLRQARRSSVFLEFVWLRGFALEED